MNTNTNTQNHHDPAQKAKDQANQETAIAANPNTSAWVSANAGSGKTHVLISRIIRLLLEDNPPEKILCLTYTRAASAEMTARLFTKLAQWITLDNANLIEEIKKLGAENINPQDTENARKLFARALETPGGFKIYTLHAFCQSILARFPLEAGLSSQSKPLDETEAKNLLKQARTHILHQADIRKHTHMGEALQIINQYGDGEQFDKPLSQLLELKNRHILKSYEIYNQQRKWHKKLGIPESFNSQTFPKIIMQAINQTELKNAIQNIEEYGKPNDKKLLPYLNAGICELDIPDNQWIYLFEELYLKAFLTEDKKPNYKPRATSRFITKLVREKSPQTAKWMEKEQVRIYTAYHTYLNGRVYEATDALITLAKHIIQHYDDLKKRQSAHDYNDIIRYTRALLENQNTQWVMYKLDGGIDHILIDEAQDTSPEQWDIIKMLAEEFFAGAGIDREIQRTLFAVGDYKQSIFSFQGANPDKFKEMQHTFAQKIKGAECEFHNVPFYASWRSAETVLKVVDHVFNKTNAKEGVHDNPDTPLKHIPIRYGQAGKIEIWETEKPDENNQESNPWNPDKNKAADSPLLRLTRRIANKINAMIGKEYLPSQNRNIQAGDILILVRRREPIVPVLIRELKKHHIPIAGTDRLKLTNHGAIQDLLTLAKVMLNPEDDLSLATLIKSPIAQKENGEFFDENDLFEIAHNRKNTLFQELQKNTDPKWQHLYKQLKIWKQKSQNQTPLQFYAEILGKEKKHRAFTKRMGSEVIDPIDEFMEYLWQYSIKTAPNLHGFIHQFEAEEKEIKRDMEQGKNEVRIMTVHAAKGLEANIVFLPDTCATLNKSKDDPILYIDAEIPIWRLKTEYQTPITTKARDHHYQDRLKEYHRLLYVALTRAKDQLYLCGWQGKNKRPETSWYDLVTEPLFKHPDIRETRDPQTQQKIWILENKQETKPEKEKDNTKDAYIPKNPPEWAHKHAKQENNRHILNPSQLISKGENPNQNILSPIARKNGQNQFQNGTIIHKILQYIPEIKEEKRDETLNALIKKYAPHYQKDQSQHIKKHIRNIITNPQFKHFFKENGLSEAQIAGKLPIKNKENNRHIHINGYIDRIVFAENHIYLLDFKTNQNPPDTPEKIPPIYIRQIALYKLALEKQPQTKNKKIISAILWTTIPEIMEIPENLIHTTLQKYINENNMTWAA